VRAEFLETAVVSAKFFLVGNQVVNGMMTVPANRDRLVHLVPRELLLEPLVRVTRPWNEMVLGRTAADAAAEFAAPGLG
jgi:hypothetical protein